MEFREKVILITGASSGIGADTARHLASLGGKIALIGRNVDRLNKVADEIKCSGSSTPLVIVADLTKDTKRIVDETILHYGKLDVLVNNAGINIETSIMDSKIDQFDQMFDINVRSLIELCKLCVPHLERTKGNIVNVSSICGIVPVHRTTFYSITKAALDQFTKCAANEFGTRGIRINSVNPGLVDTPMIGEDKDKSIENTWKRYPVRRIGYVNDISRSIAFLASDRSEFITGTLLPVDGGAIAAAAY